jgi:hypothetical protein
LLSFRKGRKKGQERSSSEIGRMQRQAQKAREEGISRDRKDAEWSS